MLGFVCLFHVSDNAYVHMGHFGWVRWLQSSLASSPCLLPPSTSSSLGWLIVEMHFGNATSFSQGALN